MRGAILYGPRDVRFEERDAPTIIKPTDAVIRISATCVCGSELWPYRGISPVTQPTPMGHEYCGIVEEVGNAVTSFKPGQFVIGSFFASDNRTAKPVIRLPVNPRSSSAPRSDGRRTYGPHGQLPAEKDRLERTAFPQEYDRRRTIPRATSRSMADGLAGTKGFNLAKGIKKCRSANLEIVIWKFRLSGSAAWE